MRPCMDNQTLRVVTATIDFLRTECFKSFPGRLRGIYFRCPITERSSVVHSIRLIFGARAIIYFIGRGDSFAGSIFEF